MKRIYHTWEKWECYPAGFYESQPKDDWTPKQCETIYRDLLRDTPMFEASLCSVITQWKRSCEHYLSNEKMNRIAWLGQAALCVARGIPSCFRGGFNLLTDEEQVRANASALKFLNRWLVKHDEPEVTLEGAGIKNKVDLY